MQRLLESIKFDGKFDGSQLKALDEPEMKLAKTETKHRRGHWKRPVNYAKSRQTLVN